MSWQVLDYQVYRNSQPFVEIDAETQGAVITLPAVAGSQVWRVERTSVWVANNPNPESVGGGLAVPVMVQIFDQVPIQPNAAPCDQTYAGVFDVADNSQPITLREGDQMSFVFVCSTPLDMSSAAACVRAQYAILGGGAAAAPTPVAGASPAPAIPTDI